MINYFFRTFSGGYFNFDKVFLFTVQELHDYTKDFSANLPKINFVIKADDIVISRYYDTREEAQAVLNRFIVVLKFSEWKSNFFIEN